MNNYLIKKLAAAAEPFVYYSGIHCMLKSIYQGKGHILMFHRVVNKTNADRIHNHQSLEVTPEHLEDILKFFKSRDYKFISLDTLAHNIETGKLQNKFVVVTFDDGYKDNLHEVYPIMKKYQVPYTVYVTTSFPENKALIWWYALEDLLIRERSIEITDSQFKRKIPCSSITEKELAFNNLRSFFQKYTEIEISSFFSSNGIDISDYVKNMALTWKEIVEMSSEDLITIGAHTVNHKSLAKLSYDEAYEEISNSKKILESKINNAVNHFSYPFGKITDAGNREFQIAEKVGFKTSTTTRLANIFEQHIKFPQAFPRISVNSHTNYKTLVMSINGFYPMIRNNFKPIVTE